MGLKVYHRLEYKNERITITEAFTNIVIVVVINLIIDMVEPVKDGIFKCYECWKNYCVMFK